MGIDNSKLSPIVSVPPGFKRDELRARYDVAAIHEDDWHSHSGERSSRFVADHLSQLRVPSYWLLNAGAGVYEIRLDAWEEVSVDLFTAPIQDRHYAICASVERLPFQASSFGAVVCVGEVLAYCDPAATISEFARVLAPSGLLICDFGSSRSFRHWFRASYGRAADLVSDYYNGTPEQTWVYDPAYMRSLLVSTGFNIKAKLGTHTWSALARRIGASVRTGLLVQRYLDWLRLPSSCADVTTIVAVRDVTGK